MAGFLKGVQGSVYRAGKKIIRLNSYNLQMTNGIENVTDFESSGVEREYTGVVDVTGSVSGQFQLYDTSTGGGTSISAPQQTIVEQSETSGTLAGALWKFIESSKSMWFGTVLVADWSKDNSAEGIQTFSATIQGNGRLTHSVSTST